MYDNICKFIAETFPKDLSQWLLGKTIDLTILEPTDLQVDPIRADSVIFLKQYCSYHCHSSRISFR